MEVDMFTPEYDTSVLSSDFVPDTDESRSLRERTIRQSNEVAALNTELIALQLRGHEVQERISKLEGNMSVNKALMSPNRWLSPEILGEIFMHCMSPNNDVTVSSQVAPLLLVQVCRRWKRIAYGTPQLWEKLCLGRGFSLDPFAIIPLWIRNSGNISFDFRMSIQDWRHSSTPRLVERDLIRLLEPSLHRCRSLAGSMSTMALGELFGHDILLPRLESLDLWLPDQDQLSSAGALPLSGRLQAPCLRSITLNDTSFVTRSLPKNLPMVQHLQLTGRESFGLLSHSSCLDFITSCPNLQSCILTLSKDPGRPILSPVILESLQHLHLIFQFSPHDPVPFLTALQTPFIRRLTLQNHGGVSPVPHIRRVINLLLSQTVRPHTIMDLHLSSIFVPTSDWVPSLQELTEIQSLSIVGDSLDESFFSALTFEVNSFPRPCPQLRSLNLNFVSGLVGLSGDRLVAFIRSRAPFGTSGSEDGSSYLQSVSFILCDLEKRHEKELREIVKQCDGALRVFGLEPPT